MRSLTLISLVLALGVIASSARVAHANERVIPIRFVEPLWCDGFNQPGTPGCPSRIDPQLLYEAVDRMNGIYGSVWTHFWIKSIERYNMPFFFDKNEQYADWSEVGYELRQVFRNMPYDAYHDDETKKQHDWLSAATQFYGEPNEIVIWLQDGGSVTKSDADFPWNGRAQHIVLGNITGGTSQPTSHLAHEMGHFFGLRHPWEEVTTAWDLWACWDLTGSIFGFDSYLELQQNCNGPLLQLVRKQAVHDACRALNPVGTFECDMAGFTVHSSHGLLEGIAHDTGEPHLPPGSWGTAVNVMVYYGSFANPELGIPRLDYSTPAFISESQGDMVRDYRDNDRMVWALPRYLDKYGTWPKNAIPTADKSLREDLGRNNDDFVWYGNGDFSFTARTNHVATNDYIPVAGDFDGDKTDDILWYHPYEEFFEIWWGTSEMTFSQSEQYPFETGFEPFAGDFNGDEQTDIFFYNPEGELGEIWWSLGNRDFDIEDFETKPARVPAVGNFDGENGDDILWYDEDAGEVYFWWSDPAATFEMVGALDLPEGPYTPVCGDFVENEDKDEVIWFKPDGEDRMWVEHPNINRAMSEHQVTDVEGPHDALVGDFNGDGMDDILWHSDFFWQQQMIWQGGGSVADPFVETLGVEVFGIYRAVSGDFDGDTFDDIFWYYLFN